MNITYMGLAGLAIGLQLLTLSIQRSQNPFEIFDPSAFVDA